jgi:hypothetical protein
MGKRMSYDDFKIIEELFKKEKKEPKVKKEISFKDVVKFMKEMKEYEEWKKSNEKKEDKKDDKKDKTWWDNMSVIQKVTVLTAFVPVIFITMWVLPVLVVMRMFGVH